MTEEIAATPGWFEARLDEALSGVACPPAIRAAYLDCVAAAKAPAAPTSTLGAEDERCRARLLRALNAEGLDASGLGERLEALEAELAEAS